MSLNGEKISGGNFVKPENGSGRVGLTGSQHPACLPWLRAIRDEAERKAACQAAYDDGDGIIRPTHVIHLDGEIVGAVALGSCALVDVWAHRVKMKARSSLHLLNLVENLAAAQGVQIICLPCTDKSPYRPFMAKFGYQYLGESGLHYKNLKG